MAPSASITTPAANNQTLSAGTSLAGSATDEGGSGFDRVEVLLRDLDTFRWYDFGTGTFPDSGLSRTEATLSNTSISATDWSLAALSLPPGRYRLYVRAVDNAGNAIVNANGNAIWTQRSFVVPPS